VVGYVLSPLDLIPDFVPVLGYLDDLIIVPAGIALALRLVPAAVLTDCREQAQTRADQPVSRAGAVFVLALWLLTVGGWSWCFGISSMSPYVRFSNVRCGVGRPVSLALGR
jgi:hypothetical protein